jgi:heptosyltransferase II
MNICTIYSHHKLGDLIWQLPYIQSISSYHNSKITLVTRPSTQAKDILKDEDYIKKFFYCKFRKNIWYFVEILILYIFFKKNSFSHVYILDKISRPAIAAKLAGIKNIIGPGIKSQKKWLTNQKYLNNSDYKNFNYSEQSEMLLNLNGIKVENKIPKINITESSLKNIYPKINSKDNKIISFGVDSFELYKMWFEDQFAELANMLNDSGFSDQVFLIASKKNSDVIRNIIKFSGKNIFYDCSKFNLLQIIKIIKNSKFYVGNNSGPLNLASALNIKAFGLIANDRVSELKNSNIIPILPNNYKDEFFRDREGMRRLEVQNVYNQIISHLV